MSAVKKTMFDYAPALSDAEVSAVLPQGVFMLDDGTSARRAASCLLQPQAGDRVLLATIASETFVLAVLERIGEKAELDVPGAASVQLRAPRVQVAATESIELQSACDIELTAAAGKLSLNARHLLTTVTDALIQNARQYITHVESYALKARALLRLHGRDAIVTAEKDVNVDAERINLG